MSAFAEGLFVFCDTHVAVVDARPRSQAGDVSLYWGPSDAWLCVIHGHRVSGMGAQS